ncbi:PssD/Cps14F family polysaccharide biosynthesis glycosyltransferase [Croceivirga thetidis]|uniref:Polysaccharide biosynthesis protein n=1 Tax=Croceivirga thetidis TaxID=2721623 RepID=A0ABX1GQ56_9FLAO|nr:PssD/Cps14F family polysaccharide biosynthesis glycosyltransferase [Croceivirga thetidis]NKI32048.1 polysaccharide biosynthesis protein [Croceivirga thetidis]
MSRNSKKKKIILICSDGGHFAQIRELEPLFTKYDYLIVTEKSKATIPMAERYNMKFLKSRPKGSGRGLGFYFSVLQNLFLSIGILIGHYPKVVITTGSHTALPMCFLAKLVGSKVVWILSFARVKSKAFSANIAYPICNRFIVQWPEMTKHYKKAIHLGGIY